MAPSSTLVSPRPALLRPSALLVALVAATAIALGPAWAASAHSTVVDSTPSEGETLTALPDTFSITANEPMLDVTGEGAGFALQIVDGAGRHYEQACPVVDGEELSTPAALGEPGDYELRYQFVSADGHAVSGSIPFGWAPAADVEASIGTEASACGGGSPSDADSTAEPGAVDDGAVEGAAGPSAAVWISLAGVLAGATVAIGVAISRRRATT